MMYLIKNFVAAAERRAMLFFYLFTPTSSFLQMALRSPHRSHPPEHQEFI
ncbi:MAG: hypothetical protein RM338_25460 [Nostoc sp. DedQUE12a]|nr:hypothetical protein [Nostoc sp. DedQUE12a]